jgi:hypothetical protein
MAPIKQKKKYAFIAAVGMVLLQKIMVPAVYRSVLQECVAGYVILKGMLSRTLHTTNDKTLTLPSFQQSFFG